MGQSAHLAEILAFDVIGGRVLQYTMKSSKGEDHCIKCQDLVFIAIPSGETDATMTSVGLYADENFYIVDSHRILACDFSLTQREKLSTILKLSVGELSLNRSFSMILSSGARGLVSSTVMICSRIIQRQSAVL